MYTITVTNLNDSGTGSLRQAILDANSYTGADEIQIVFDTTIEDACLVLESDIEIPVGVTLYLKEGVAIDVTHANFYIDGVVVADNAEVKDAFICTEVVNEDMYGEFEFHEILVSEGGKLVLNNANINLQPVLGDEIYSYSFFYDVYIESGGELVMNGGSVRLLQGGVCLAQGATASLSSLTECAYISNYGTLTLVDVSDLESLSGSKDSVLIARNVQINDRFHLKGDITADNVRCDSIQVYDSAACTLTQVNEGLIVTGDKKIYKYNFGGNVVEETMEYVDSLNIKWSDTESPLSLDLGGVVSEDTVLTLLPDGGGYTCRGGVSLEPNVSLTLEEGVFLDFAYNYLSVDEGSLIIDWENEGDAIRIQSDYQEVSLRAGGSIYVRNANIIGDVYLMGGTFTMTGGALKAYSTSSDIDVCNNASATLSNVDVYVRVTTRNSNIRFTDCSLYNEIYMYSGEYITLNNCAVYGTVRSASPDFQIKGGNNTFYNDCLVDLHRFSGSTSSIASYFNGISGSIKAENPYIGLGYQMENCTFAKLPDLFRGGYRFTHDVSISSGYTVNLADGACWNMAEYNISSISGTLKASFSSPADALVSQQENASVAMYRGGSIAFSKANIRLSGEGSCFRMVYEATLSMDHGVFEASTLQMVQGGTLNFDSMLVEAEVNLVSGSTASITNSVINGVLNISAASSVTLKGNDLSAAQISISDMADGSVIDLSGNYWGTSDMNEIIKKIDGYNAESVIISSVIPSPYVMEVTNLNTSGAGSFSSALAKVNSGAGNIISTIQVNDSLSGETLSLSSDLSCSTICVIEGNNLKINNYKLSSSSDIIIHDLTLPEIFLSDTAKLTAENLTLTAQEAIRLTNWSGNVDFTGVTATADAAYVGLTGTFGDTTLAALPASFAGGYMMTGSVTVKSGATVTLAEGVCIGRTGGWLYLYINGTLEARNKEVADALTATQDRSSTYVQNGGKLLLENANVNLGGWDSYLYVQGGGTLEMSGGSLYSWGGLRTWSNGVASLVGVEVKSSVSNEGSMSMTSCRMNNQYVTLNSGSTSTIINTAGIGRLTINRGCNVTIQGNDFSGTTIVLNNIPEGEIIDLSGNYWGTTDIELIKGKIQGYDEARVLINTVLSEPNAQVFTFDSSMLGAHRVSDTAESLVLTFNAAVDAETVSENSIRLVDAQGAVLSVTGFEVNGNKVTVLLDSFPQGQYRVEVGAELKDIYGNAFSEPADQRKVNFLSLPLAAPRVILFRSNSTVTDQFRYVDIFFDQDMDASTVSKDNIHIYTESGVEVNINRILQSGIQGNVFFRAYFDEVTEQGTYRIVVDAEVQTSDGRSMTADYVKEVYVSSPDLEVPGLVEYTDNHLGRYTTISYSVTNSGDGVAQGSWTDHIYLCKSETWDEDQAIFLASVEQKNKSVQPGDVYTGSARVVLDGLEPGEYYVFVKADMASRVSEGNENNNVSATGTKISIGVPEFAGDSVAGRLSSANETLYYTFTPTESGSYILTVDDSSATVVVTSSINGKALNKKTSAKLTHYSVFSAKAGETYYIAIKGGKDTSYTTQIQKSEFAVYASSFTNLASGHPSTLTLVGSEFAEGMAVYVVDENGVRYDAERVTIVDSCQATVTFSLPEGLASGTAVTLYVQNEANTVVKLDETLHIASFSELVELEFTNMNGWSSAAYSRVGYVWKTDLIAGNKAGYDVSNAIILVTDTAEDFAMYYSYGDAKVRDRSALLFLGGVDALTPKVMTAGEFGRLGVYVKHYRSGTGAIQAWLLDPGSSEQITDAQWAYFESALRPTTCSDADWSAWWSDMKPRIGDTIGDFTTFIYGMRDAVSAAGQKVNVSSLADLTDIAMKHCPDYAPSQAVHGLLTDSSTGEALSGVDIYLYKIDGDKSVHIDSAITDESGAYSLYGMKIGGTYELKVNDFWCNGTEVPTSSSGQFICEQEEDIRLNGVIQQIEPIEIKTYRSNSIYAEDTTGGLLSAWNENEVAYISYDRNNSVWQHYLDTALIENSKLTWSEADDCFILSWIEHEADDSKLFWQYIRLGETGLEKSEIQSRLFEGGCANSYLLSSASEGVAAVIRSNDEASELPEVIAITPPDQFDWSELKSAAPMTTAESWTGGTPETLKFSISPSSLKKLGVLWSWLNPSGRKGTPDGSIDATITWENGQYGKVELAGSSSIKFWTLAGKVSTVASIEASVSGSLTATCKDLADEESQSCTTICKGNTLDWSGTFSPSVKLSLMQPHGLLKAIKWIPFPGTKLLGKGIEILAKLVEKYTPLKIRFGYGVSTTLSGSFSYDDGKWKYHGVDYEGLKLNVIIGGTYDPYKVTYEGGLSIDADVDLQNWSFDVKGAEPFGIIDINIPWKGATITFNGTLMELLAKGMKIVGQTIWDAGEWVGEKVGDGSFYAIKWVKGKWLELKEWTKGTIDATETKAIEFYNDAKRLIGKENAHFIKTANAITNDNIICLVGVGSTDTVENLHGQSLTWEELEKYDEMLSDSLDSVLVDAKTGQAILVDQGALENYGYSPLALTSGDSTETAALAGSDITKRVIDAEVLLYDDQVRLSWICNINGKYQLFFATLENGAWCNPELILESENTLSSCKLSEIRNQLIVTVTETDLENQLYQDKQFVWGGDEWSPYQSAAVEQTSAESLLHNTAAPVNVVSSFKEIIQSIERKIADLIGCPLPEPETELPHENFQSYDPNDFYGPAAYGAENWIAPREMQFQILCENIPEENIAHAAMVTIKHKLDDAYDYSTFRLGDMMIGGNYIEVEEDVTSYKARLDWTSTLGVLVDVNAFFDADTGEVVWEFVAIDPETGWIVSDPFKGLLAPNYNPPEGDGWVYYYAAPKETTLTGTKATSQAEIIFDYNDPILTPVLSYTFDSDSPVAQVKALAESSSSRFLRVDWSGTDTGSGVACYNVFVSVDGGDWELWQENINATSALYTVAVGEHRYAFFAQAIDHTGLAEELAEQMPAEAATTTTHSPCKLTVTSLEALRAGDELTLRIVFSEKALCADWAAALQVTTSTQAIELSTGSFRYDESTHTLTWDGSVAGVPDGAQTTVRLKDGLVTDAQGQAFGSVAPAYSAPIALAGVAGSTYAAPALVDYNADGLMDVLVGEVAENGKGRIRIYLNEGTAEVASFASFIYASTAEDTPIELEASGCQGAIVRLADLTGDGKDEMVVGLADGTIRIFTAAEGGYWTDSGELTCSVGGESEQVDAGTRAAIEFVDANGDGRSDMLVGTGDGNVLLYLNTAAAGAAVFDAGRYLHDAAGRIDVGTRASVSAGDFDGDGVSDMLLGSADGSILFYRNEGSAAEPLFATGVKLLSADKELDLSAETSRLRLDAADVNGDGLLDVVLGQSDGAVRVLYGSDGSSLLGVVQAGDNPLYAVENVQALAYGGQVRLSWDAVEGATYELSYKLAGDAVAQVLELEDAVAVLPLADGRYELSVRALTPEGTGPWSAPLAVLVDTVAPLSPESLQASAGENGSVRFSWAEADSATTYELRYKTVDSGSWQTLSCKATSVTLYNLPGGAYDWQVRAVDAAGNTSGWVSGAGFESTGAAAERVTWARGLSFDTTGKVTGGYYDIAKTGEGDSNLCWAAAAANILGWWQQQYPTGSALAGVPQDAAAIYACFCANWANKSGSESYAFTWWLADESDSASYMNYYYQNYQGSGELGGWYADYYNVANIGNHTAQVKLADMEAADVASEWNGIYRSGGMLALGVYRSYSSGSFAGGHSLTLWGFQEDAQGRITQIHVTDSDDEQSSLLTLDVELDTASGLYRIAGEQGNVSGYYLGSYTYLKAGGMTPDGSSPEQAESLGMSSARDGSGHYSGSTLNWVGAGDAVDFFSITAAGDGAYRVGVDSATLETTLRLSVGVLNGQGLFEVQQQMLLAPGAALAGLLGVQAGQGETLYVKVEALDTASAGTGGFYELNISGTVPAAGSGLATQDNSAEEAAESSADGSATRGWVGAGDACDFYRVEMAAAGSLSIGLDELEAAARVRIYEQRADGSLAQLDSRAVKVASGLDATLSLTSGTYFVEVASLDAGAGQYNTAYSLTLEKEEQQAAESERNIMAQG